MRRELIVNWAVEHDAVKRETERPKIDYGLAGDSGKGWSYVTFFPPGTRREKVLFNLDLLQGQALENGYFLPREAVCRHNKVVVTAVSQLDSNPSVALLALWELLQTYAARFSDLSRFPDFGFYGKIGGIYDRPEKGRVLALYALSDDALLAIDDGLDSLIGSLKTRAASFEHHLSNGLSAIPRMLDGYDDPHYRETGITHYRITDPHKFERLLEQAREDYGRYLFEKAL